MVKVKGITWQIFACFYFYICTGSLNESSLNNLRGRDRINPMLFIFFCHHCTAWASDERSLSSSCDFFVIYSLCSKRGWKWDKDVSEADFQSREEEGTSREHLVDGKLCVASSESMTDGSHLLEFLESTHEGHNVSFFCLAGILFFHSWGKKKIIMEREKWQSSQREDRFPV